MTTPAAPDQINRDLAHAGIDVPLLAQEDVHWLPAMRGAYALILNLAHEVQLDRPRQAARALSPGWYIYAGSARGPGGIRARLARHFREEKRNHWHIDQLTGAAGARIWASPAPEGHECDLVAKFVHSGRFRTVCPGFGNSDCRRCVTHLLVWKTKQ